MSWLTRVALKQAWITLALVALIVFASVWALITLQVELFPNIDLPMTAVVVIDPQASAEQMVDDENGPTLLIEDAMSDLSGLKYLISNSGEGRSIVFAEFEYGTDMDSTDAIIRERIDAIDFSQSIRSLPEMMPQLGMDENPTLIALDLSMMPLVIFGIKGDIPAHELQKIADDYIIPRLSAIDGVYLVSTDGGVKSKAVLSANPAKMNEYGISMSQVLSLTAGREYASLSQVEEVALTDNVVVGDISSIVIGTPPGAAISRYDGEPSVSVMVMKEPDANSVEVAHKVHEEMDRIRAEVENGEIEIATGFDQSKYIEESISDLTREAIVGGILAVIVVFLFLMVFRASAIVALSIPLSLLVGFLIMRVWGITINIITLSAMAIAVGRVIDDSIVLLEIIYRHMQEGKGFKEAGIAGAREIATPITGATLATVAIFLPLAFVGGVIGELFIPFALTITFALIASLLVSLMAVPALTRFLVVKKRPADVNSHSWYVRLYLPTLRWAMGHRIVTLSIAALIFIGSMAVVPFMSTAFIPQEQEKMLTINIALPEGAEIAETAQVTAEVEKLIDDNLNVQYHTTVIGVSTSIMGAFMSLGGMGGNTSQIIAVLDEDADLTKEARSFRKLLEGLNGAAEIEVIEGSEMSAMMGGTALDVIIRGDNQESLLNVTNILFEELESIEGIDNLDSAIKEAKLGLDIQPNIEKAMSAGLSEEQLARVNSDLYVMTRGSDVPGAAVRVDDVSYDVYLKGIGRAISSVDEAKMLGIGFPESVTLDQVADVDLLEKTEAIWRYDQMPASQITGTISASDVGAVNDAVQEKIDAIELPEGVEGIETAGVAEQMQETFKAMVIAIIAAIFISFFIVVIFMRSIFDPIIIMFSLPLATIGAVLGLLITGRPIGASAAMGVLMLVGIVLTNAIVLVTMIDQLRKRGMDVEGAIFEAGQKRLRPILMTAITTMIALIPLAVGMGSGALMAAELATVVIGGLFSSTLLTLLVIPVSYSVGDDIRNFIRNLFGNRTVREEV